MDKLSSLEKQSISHTAIQSILFSKELLRLITVFSSSGITVDYSWLKAH